jgi:carboxymethylenebutenolidase
MNGQRVDVSTVDGALDCYLFTPDGAGQWPAVIVYMDAFGIRTELGEMAQRLASSGYVVALPNLYYRTGPFPPFDKRAVAADGPERDRFKGMIQSITSAMVMRDTAAIIDMLDAQPAVRRGGMGALGYCMGGGYALAAAGTYPDRIVAAASFHGGSLATDKPDSPHTFASQMRGRIYVGAAEIDPGFPDEQKVRLERALTAASVDYVLETYAGAKHGFAVNGHLVYDRDAAERHWTVLQTLFAETLH